LILQYEEKLPKVYEKMSPREALSYLMEANGLIQADLVEMVGYKSNLSAFLSGKRGLSTRAAAKLGSYFRVSPTLFLDLA
jgi:HTH-type transcriptional regulator/antitoxin HigA